MMMLDSFSWSWLALPFSAVVGLICATLALAYVKRVTQGAAIDGATLWAAFKALCERRAYGLVPGWLALLSAGLLVLMGLDFAAQPSALAAARFGACCVLLVLAVIDARCRLLPDALTLPLMWAGLLLAWAGLGVNLHDAVLAACAGYAVLRGIDLAFQLGCGRTGMGGGDMKLVAALGAWLGWERLPGVLLAACCAAVLYAFFGRHRQSWRASLPFGPFLAFSGAAGLLGGPVVQFLF